MRRHELHVRWALALALLALVIEHTAGIFETTRDFFEAGGLLIAERGGWGRPEWLDAAPYTITPWGPGYHVAAAAVHRMVPGWDLLVTGRAISLVAGLITASLVAIVVIQRTAVVEAGLLAAAAFLSYAGISFWLQLFRVDALATLISVAAYTVPLSSTGLYASAALVAIGSLVKQTVLLAAVPVALHLAWTERRKDALLYVLLVASGAVLAWTGVLIGSRGYYAVSWVANQRTYAVDQAVRLVGDFVRHTWTYAAILALASAWWYGARPLRTCRFALALVVVWLAAAAMSGVEGASSNFFLEPAAIAAIVIGIHGVAVIWQRQRLVASVLLWGVSVAIALSAVMTTVRVIRDRPPLEDFTRFHHTLATSTALVDWRYILAALRAGIQPVVNDPFFMTMATRNHVFPIDRLVPDVRAGRVGGLILFGPIPASPAEIPGWPPELAIEFRTYFEPAGIVSGAHLYRYRRP